MEYYNSPPPLQYQMPYQAPYPMAPVRKPRNGLVWYVILLPILGLLFENFAPNKYLGMLVWGIVVVMRPVSCAIDRARLIKNGFAAPESAFCILPTVYLYRRAKVIRGESQLAIICALTLFVAGAGNSFVRGMRMTEDTILEAVKATYLTSFDELKDSGLDLSLGEAVENSLKDPEYTIERDGDKRTITLNATNDDGTLIKIVITVEHDGFTYKGLTLSEVYSDGQKIEDDKVEKFLERLFKNLDDMDLKVIEKNSETE